MSSQCACVLAISQVHVALERYSCTHLSVSFVHLSSLSFMCVFHSSPMQCTLALAYAHSHSHLFPCASLTPSRLTHIVLSSQLVRSITPFLVVCRTLPRTRILFRPRSLASTLTRPVFTPQASLVPMVRVISHLCLSWHAHSLTRIFSCTH